ncbi:MAG: TRAP transporter substrate-binding protein DctP [Proteobacteria bacterium]|nr:TRAP transporter substrate-binding protein DctP [Pseudomonadota bacterium]
MKLIATALAVSLALLLQIGSVVAADPQRWSIMITRPNLNSFDDAQQQAAFDRIKARTQGSLDIKTAFIGSLPIKETEWLRAVRNGDLEMAMIVGDYHAGDFPLLGLIQTPFLFRDQAEKSIASAAAFPVMQREANKLNIQLLAMRPYGEIGFWTTEPVSDITKLAGRKIRAQAKLFSDMIEAAGGVPVPVAFAEAYTALQNGLVKGILTGYDSITGAKLHEVAPYAHNIKLSNQFQYTSVNKTKWDALPPETRLIVLEELGRAMQIIQANVPNLNNDEIAKQKAGGLKAYDPEPPAGWFELMSEKVAKPTLVAELKRSGAAGEDLLAAIEAAIGRKVR